MLAMDGSRPKRKPSFFWQGLLILLPVGIVSTVALMAIHRDRAVVEQEARKSAGQLVDQLALALAKRVPAKLAAFDLFSETWSIHQSALIKEVRRGLQSESFSTELNEWAADYPGLAPESVLPNRLGFSSQGALVWPHDYAEPPQVPAWFLALTPPQRQAWEAMCALERTGPGTSNLESKIQEFLHTGAPPEAQASARFALLRSRLARQSGLEALLELHTFAEECRGCSSESGLPLLSLVAAEALRVTRRNGPGIPVVDFRNGSYLGVMLDWILDEPSVVTPRLLSDVQQLAGSNAAAKPAIEAATATWSARERLHAISVRISRRGLLPDSTPTNFWLEAPSSLWFCRAASARLPALETQTDSNRTGLTDNVDAWLRIYPKQVIDRAFASSIRELGLAPPDYADLELELEGQPVTLAPRPNPTFEALPLGSLKPLNPHRIARRGAYYLKGTIEDGSAPERGRILAESQGQFAALPVRWSSGDRTEPASPPLRAEPEKSASFTLQVSLANPELLFARQRQRSWLFGGLILASMFACCVGLAAAYRSFRRQLRLNELKSNFVSSVSHELRAPIASVRLMAESLERGKIPDSAKQQEYFRFIVQECRRLSSLIENVLDFSRIEQGRKQFEFEPTNFIALTKQTVKLMEAYATERHVALALRMADELLACPGAQLAADGKALQQALINLIDNAVKHSPKGQTVTVGVELQDAAHRSPEPDPGARKSNELWLILWVEDLGEGIPAEEHEKIFERFYRLGSELRRQTQGVGIGLSIVKHVVEAHGGRVRVRSAVGQGSRFSIELPLQPEGWKPASRDPKSH